MARHLDYSCPACESGMFAFAPLSGRTVRCHECGAEFRLPEFATLAERRALGGGDHLAARNLGARVAILVFAFFGLAAWQQWFEITPALLALSPGAGILAWAGSLARAKWILRKMSLESPDS